MSTTPTPNLGTIITSGLARKVIYGVYVVLIVIAGGIQVAFAAVSTDQPTWLTAGLAVLAYLGVPIGGLALANTSTAAPGDHTGV